MFDVLMHECAKHASEYRQEQAGTTWGQQRERSSQVLPLDSGNLDASGNVSSREDYDLPNSASQYSSPNLHAHSSRPALSIAYVIRDYPPAAMTCIISRSCIAV